MPVVIGRLQAFKNTIFNYIKMIKFTLIKAIAYQPVKDLIIKL